jgi:hypothetical protein
VGEFVAVDSQADGMTGPMRAGMVAQLPLLPYYCFL